MSGLNRYGLGMEPEPAPELELVPEVGAPNRYGLGGTTMLEQDPDLRVTRRLQAQVRDEPDVMGAMTRAIDARVADLQANDPSLTGAEAGHLAFTEMQEKVQQDPRVQVLDRPETLAEAGKRAFLTKQRTRTGRKLAPEDEPGYLKQIGEGFGKTLETVKSAAQGYKRFLQAGLPEGEEIKLSADLFGGMPEAVGGLMGPLAGALTKVESVEGEEVIRENIMGTALRVLGTTAYAALLTEPAGLVAGMSPEERGRSWRGDAGGPRGYLFDVAEAVSKAEGASELGERWATATGRDPELWRGLGLIADFLVPIEIVPAKLVGAGAKAATVGRALDAPAGVKAGVKTLFGKADASLDVVDGFMKRIDGGDDVPVKIRDRAATIHERDTGWHDRVDLEAEPRWRNLDYVEAVMRDLEQPLPRRALARDLYMSAVHDSVQSTVRQSIGSRHLVKMARGSMVTKSELADISRRSKARVMAAGLDADALVKRPRKGKETMPLVGDEAAAFRGLAEVHAKDPGLVTRLMDDAPITELPPKWLEDVVNGIQDAEAGRSAQAGFQFETKRPLVDAAAKMLEPVVRSLMSDPAGAERTARNIAHAMSLTSAKTVQRGDMSEWLRRALNSVKREADNAPRVILAKIRDMKRQTATGDFHLPAALRTLLDPDLLPDMRYMGPDSIVSDIRRMPRNAAIDNPVEVAWVQGVVDRFNRDVTGKLDTDLDVLRNPDATVTEQIVALEMWERRQTAVNQTFYRVLLTAFARNPKAVNMQDAGTISRMDRVLQAWESGDMVALRDQIINDVSPLRPDSEAMFVMAAVSERNKIAQTFVETLADQKVGVRDKSYNIPLIEGLKRAIRGHDIVMEVFLEAPDRVLQMQGKANTPTNNLYRFVETKDPQKRAKIGDELEYKGYRPLDPETRAGKGVSLGGMVGDLGLRPYAQPFIRAHEVGSELYMDKYNRLIAEGKVKQANELLSRMNDASGRKYRVWDAYREKYVGGLMTLEEASGRMAAEQDMHHAIEAQGSGRVIVRWKSQKDGKLSTGPDDVGTGNQNIDAQGKPEGTMVTHFLNTSPAEKARLYEEVWAGGAPALAPEKFLAQTTKRGRKINSRFILTDHYLQRQVAAYQQMWGELTPESTIMKAGDVFLPQPIATEVGDLFASATDLKVMDMLPNVAAEGFRQVTSLNQIGVYGGFFPFLNAGYFAANAIMNPFILHTTSGVKGLGQMAMWAKHPMLLGQLLAGLTRYVPGGGLFERFGMGNWAKDGGLVTDAGHVYPIEYLISLARREDLDVSAASVDLQRGLLSDLHAMDPEWRGLGGLLGKSKSVAGEVAIGYTRDIGAAMDQTMRLAVWLDEIKRGANPDEAAAAARTALLDYGGLNKFESTVVRNVMMGYTYKRAAFWATLKSLQQAPHRTAQQARLLESMRDRPDWLGGMTEEQRRAEGERDLGRAMVWASPSRYFGVTDPRYGGTMMYTQSVPFAEAAADLDMLLGLTSLTGERGGKPQRRFLTTLPPLVAATIELGTGRTIYSGAKLGTDPETYRIPRGLLMLDAGNDGFLHWFFQVEPQPTRDPALADDASPGMAWTYEAAGGELGRRRWRAFINTPAQRFLTDSMFRYQNALTPRPHMTQAQEIAGLGFYMKQAVTEEELQRREAASIAAELKQYTRGMEERGEIRTE